MSPRDQILAYIARSPRTNVECVRYGVQIGLTRNQATDIIHHLACERAIRIYRSLGAQGEQAYALAPEHVIGLVQAGRAG